MNINDNRRDAVNKVNGDIFRRKSSFPGSAREYVDMYEDEMFRRGFKMTPRSPAVATVAKIANEVGITWQQARDVIERYWDQTGRQ